MIGRAKLKITDTLISVVLQTGISAVRPEKPLRDARVVDVGFDDRRGLVELLLEGDGLEGPPDAALANAPVLDFLFERRAVIDEDIAVEVALAFLRIQDSAGPKGGHDDTAPARPEAELATRALARIPDALIERARARRLELGETIPPPDPADVTDEVPGA